MNNLGITLVTAAVQVTLAALPAVLLVALAGRRSSRTAVALSVVALGFCLGLTLTAFAPPPPWGCWFDAAIEPSPATAASVESFAAVPDPARRAPPVRGQPAEAPRTSGPP